MVQKISVTPIVGLPQFTGWAQVVDVVTETNIGCVISIAIEGEGAASIGQAIADDIVSTPPRSAEALYQVFEDVIEQLRDMRCECSLAGGVFRPGRSILATYRGAVTLKRGSKVGPALSSDSTIEIIQGKAQIDDVFVFSTLDARQFLSAVSLTYEKGYDTDSVVTSIVPALHSLENSSRCALGFAVIEQRARDGQQGQVDEGQDDVEGEDQPEAIGSADTPAFIDEPLVDEGKLQAEVHKTATTRSADQRQHLDLQSQQAAQSRQESLEQPVADGLSNEVESAALSAELKSGGVDQKGGKKTIDWKQLFAKIGVFLAAVLSAIRSVASWLRVVGARLLELARQLIFAREYVQTAQTKRLRMIAVVVILIVVVVLVGWLYLDWRRDTQRAQAQELLEPYQTRLEAIRAQAISDPLAAREESQSFLGELNEVLLVAETENNSFLLTAAQDLHGQAEALVVSISGRDELAELEVAFDLRTQASGFIASKAVASESFGLIIDQGARQGLLVNFETNQLDAIDLSALDAIESVAMQDANTAVLLAQGLYELSLSDSATPALIKEEGDSNREATLVGAYGSYLYVFNPDRRNIYRYLFDGTEYSDPIGWLTGPLGISFDDVTSWAIDGSIWIATQDGRIRKYTSSTQDAFEISGMTESFSGRLSIVTQSDFNNLYVLEPSQQRLVVLDKEGRFLREIKNVSLAAATDLFVRESAATAYVLSGSTIFSIPL